jgi:PAS domain S-box-containing protein
LFENVPDGVYESTPDGRILAANSALVRLLGFENESDLIENIRCHQLYVSPQQRQEMTAALERDGALYNNEIELIRKDGTVITVLENARVLRSADGSTLCYQGTLTDITDRKQAIRDMMTARDEALEASRLKSQFLANISHEIRTPLNAVLGMARILSETPLDPQQRECAETIQHSAHFLLDLLSEILDFSRIEAGKLELDASVYRLRDAVEDAVVMHAEKASSKGVEVACYLAPDLPEMVLGDAARLRQAITNLAGNAVKFTASGEVVVRVFRNPAGTVTIEVRDTGIGISDEASRFIFEPFRQADGSTKRRYGGAGLGLSIANQIVSKMGGRIEFSTRPGAGSTFWFSIPLTPAPACRPPRREPPTLLRGKRALVLLPNCSLRDILCDWLREWAVVPLAASSVREAEAHSDFTLALVDEIALPESSASRRPAFVRDAAVFLLSPFGKTPASGPACVPWAEACITKPVRELSLLEIILRGLSPKPPELAASLLPLAKVVQDSVRPARILAAEDNRVNQIVIRKLVERLGYSVTVVSDGFEAVDAVRENAFDLVLMDCQMPDMDGFEATAAIRQLPAPNCKVPIVAVTAHAIHGDRERCLAAGMDDYLSKPIILDALSDILERWLPQSRPAGTPAYPTIE